MRGTPMRSQVSPNDAHHVIACGGTIGSAAWHRRGEGRRRCELHARVHRQNDRRLLEARCKAKLPCREVRRARRIGHIDETIKHLHIQARRQTSRGSQRRRALGPCRRSQCRHQRKQKKRIFHGCTITLSVAAPCRSPEGVLITLAWGLRLPSIPGVLTKPPWTRPISNRSSCGCAGS